MPLPDTIDDAWRAARADDPVLEARVSGTFARVMSYIEMASAGVIVLFGVLFDLQFIGTPFYIGGAAVGLVLAYLVLWERYRSARSTLSRDGDLLVRVDADGLTLAPSEELNRKQTVHIPWEHVRGVRTVDVPQSGTHSGRYDLYCGFDLLTPEMTDALGWERFDEILHVEDVDTAPGASRPDLPAYALSVMVQVDTAQRWLLNDEPLPLNDGDLYEQVPALFRRFANEFAAVGSIERLTGRWWLSPERAAHLPHDYVDDELHTFDGDDPWKYVNAAHYPVDEIAGDDLQDAAEGTTKGEGR
jgi:hypothetical protein